MPSEKLPWVVVKRNRNGTERWYWQRRDHGTKRLPDDPVRRLELVLALNRGADARDGSSQDTMAWCIQRYRESPAYAKLKPSTKYVYDRWLDHYECSGWGRLPVQEITRRAVMEGRDALLRQHGLATVLQAFAVLRLIFKQARNRGLITDNPASEPELETPASREAVWADEQIAAVTEVASEQVGMALRLLLYTAQRPSDVVRMAWTQYDGQSIRVRQVKTGAAVTIHVHEDLKAALDGATRKGALITTKPSGRAWRTSSLGGAIREALAKAGVTGLQARDLRRTAVVKLAEAGCTVPEIASITGHSLKTAAVILQTYLPRTGKQSRAAVLKWEQSRTRPTNRAG